MRFKLDENLGRRGLEFLRAAGHDVMTVRDQGLGGASDDSLFNVFRNEGRALITLDHDFGHVLRFPPEQGPGVVILEPGPRAAPQSLLDRPRDLLAIIEAHELAGPLCILAQPSAATKGGTAFHR